MTHAILASLATMGTFSLIFLDPTFSILASNALLFDYSIKHALPVLAFGAILWALSALFVWRARNEAASIVASACLALAPIWLAYRLLRELVPEWEMIFFVISIASIGVVGFTRSANRFVVPAAIFSVAVSVIPFTNAVSFVVSPSNFVSQRQGGLRSDLPNIYHVVFDEAQSDFFRLNINDDLADDFSGFTFYPEATTSYGHTEMAMGSIFSGRTLKLKEEAPAKFIWNAFFDPGTSLVQLLAGHGYRTEGYPFYIYPGGDISPFMSTYIQLAPSTGETSNKSAVLSYMLAFNHLPRELAARIVPEGMIESLEAVNMLPDSVPFASRDAFRDMIKREEHLPGHGRYVFLHLILPHYPHVMKADCSPQDAAVKPETKAIEQNQCAITLMKELVQELKRLGRFETSMVIFHADHGAGYVLKGDDFIWGGDQFSDGLNTGRSRALLLYKAVGSAGTKPLAISGEHRMILDVAPTILNGAGVGRPPVMTGKPLDEEYSAPARDYYTYKTDRDFVVDGPIKRYSVSNGKATFQQDIEIMTVPVDDVIDSK